MDILKAEIARKRKLLEEKKVLDPSTNRKYFKRGELLAKEQEEYLKKYGPKPDETEQSDVKDIPEKVNRQDSADAENDHTENAQLPRAEVIKRLRERSHPILLFGENELQSFKRLRRIEIQEPEANRVNSLFLRPTPGTSSTEILTSKVANVTGGKIARKEQICEQQAAPATAHNPKKIDHLTPSVRKAVEAFLAIKADDEVPTGVWSIVRSKDTKPSKSGGKEAKPVAAALTTAVQTSEVANAPRGKNARRKLRRLRLKHEEQEAPSTGTTVQNAEGPSFFYKQRQNARNTPGSKPYAPPAKSTSSLVEAAGSGGRGKEMKAGNSNRQKHAAIAITRSAQAPAAAPSQAPASIQVKGSKRTRLDDTVSPRGKHKKQKLDSNRRAPAASYAEIAQSNFCVAVLKTDNQQLTEEQATVLRKYLTSRLLDEVRDAKITFTPHFLGKPIFTNGALKVWCDDVRSFEWLTDAIEQLPSTECPNLAVVKQSELTRKVRAAIFLPECSYTLEDTILVLGKQNKWAQVQQWIVYTHQKQADDMVFVTIGIPETLIPTIMERRRRMAFGLGSVYIRFYGVDGKLQDNPPCKLKPRTPPEGPEVKPGPSETVASERSDSPAPPHSSPKPSCSETMEDICESVDMELDSGTEDEGNQAHGDPISFLF